MAPVKPSSPHKFEGAVTCRFLQHAWGGAVGERMDLQESSFRKFRLLVLSMRHIGSPESALTKKRHLACETHLRGRAFVVNSEEAILPKAHPAL